MIVFPAPITGQATTGKTWTWAYAGVEARHDATWPAVDIAVPSLIRTEGAALIGQPTAGLDARGFGSSEAYGAVVMLDDAHWETTAALALTSAERLLLRLIVEDPLASAAVTYAEIEGVLSVRRNGSLLELGGDVSESLDITDLLGDWLIIDVELEPGAGCRLWVNGVDLTPALSGAAVPVLAGTVALHLANNAAGTEPAEDVAYGFVGVLVSGAALDPAEHRHDAQRLGLLPPGLVDVGLETKTWAWSPAAVEGLVLTAEEGPDAGVDSAAVIVDTAPMLDAGLGRGRRHRALQGSAARSEPSGWPLLDDDLHVRLVARVEASEVSSVTLWSAGDVAFSVDPTTETLTVTWPGYTQTFAGAWALARWHLLDVSMLRTGGVGGAARWVVLLDGLDLGASDAVSTVADQPADVPVAVAGTWAYAVMRVGETCELEDHRLAALALGVML